LKYVAGGSLDHSLALLGGTPQPHFGPGVEFIHRRQLPKSSVYGW
jgi:hypothetical protein